MEKLGELLGWLAALCYALSFANFLVKAIFKNWIRQWPQEDVFKQLYMKLMQLIVRYHRYTGIAAGLLALCHFLIQYLSGKISYTGLIATILMVITMLTGMIIAFLGVRKLTGFHRILSFSILIVITLHVLTKI